LFAVDLWSFLLDLLLLLSAAAVLGMLAERVGQSALIGYLLAGVLLGPGALNVIHSEEVVRGLAELGVALLLFSIGLEFSWARLRRMGPSPAIGGSLQIVLTALITAALSLSFDVGIATALVIGVTIAPSSTACVLRVLGDRAELETVHGRLSLGVLLLQDAALVPLVLIVSLLGGGGDEGTVMQVLRPLVLMVVLIAGLLLANRHVAPRFLSMQAVSRSGEISILVAVAACLGATWLAHVMDLSPALGAFIAGMFLAESPFAVQIRSEVGPLRTLFLTLFFASIGMVMSPLWIAQHLPWVFGAVVVVVVGKTLITWFSLRLTRQSHRHALAAGLCLGQAGEFSFVLADLGYQGGLVSSDHNQLIISTTGLTLLLTPPLVRFAPDIAHRVESLLVRMGVAPKPWPESGVESEALRDHVIVVGFGPAGQRIVTALEEAGVPSAIADLNPASIAEARRRGLRAEVGDASRMEVLRHLRLPEAGALVVTVPDQRSALAIIAHARALAPHVPVIVRARYHVHALIYLGAGAHAVADEESEVGQILGRRVLEMLEGRGED
jgi:CPA2 family monovalent cation:H+ antiporter-2